MKMSMSQQVRDIRRDILVIYFEVDVFFSHCKEDTFILLDALEADTKLFESLNPSICLEVG